MNDVYVVILAGGKGERLWPLSRQNCPKQLLPFKNKNSLLQQTIARVQGLVSKENIWIVTTKEHEAAITALAGDSVGAIIAEPASCNTAPAILYSCLLIEQHNPEAVVVFMPSDAYIADDESFKKYLEVAIAYACTTQVIALLGVKPTAAATGYGYIECNANAVAGTVQQVARFHEKPNAQVAHCYYTMGSMLWNIGIFCGKNSFFLHEFARLTKKLYIDLKEFIAGNGAYEALEQISFDYAIMERSDAVAVVPVDFAWSDVGNLDTFLSLKNADQVCNAKVIEIDAHNNLVEVDKRMMVALIGIDDLCVVQTNDVLLIAKRSEVEKVKQVVHNLKIQNSELL